MSVHFSSPFGHAQSFERRVRRFRRTDAACLDHRHRRPLCFPPQEISEKSVTSLWSTYPFVPLGSFSFGCPVPDTFFRMPPARIRRGPFVRFSYKRLTSGIDITVLFFPTVSTISAVVGTTYFSFRKRPPFFRPLLMSPTQIHGLEGLQQNRCSIDISNSYS